MSFFPSRILAVRVILVFCAGFFSPQFSQAQVMQPGFDPGEYADLLQLNFVAMGDSLHVGDDYTMNKGVYKKIFRSPEVGLYNKVEIYLQNGNTAVISLRGTVAKAESWMENFYFAMSKATGRLRLNDSTLFEYRLAADTQAFVHTGWLLGLAHLAPFINAQLKSLLDSGITNVIVMGHSQGGALAFLTTSYIWYKYAPAYPTLKIKTYASAAPKPGNLYYAYDFDHITGIGYGYRIVNSADWVPETPVSIQTVNDFNEVNPVTEAPKILKKQKFAIRTALMHVYNRLDKTSYKSMKKYRKYTGEFIYKRVKKTLPQFEEPVYPYSMNYMTAGAPVILVGDSKYQEQFKFDGKDIFIHHMLKPYMYLLNQQFPKK
jgi:hypothetical protein